MFIESSSNLVELVIDVIIGSGFEAAFGTDLGTDRGEAALDHILKHPGGKKILGVIGFSEGAGTVSHYYAEHRDTKVPFFLVEPAVGMDPGYDPSALSLRTYRGSLPFGTDPHGSPFSHGTHEEDAAYVLFCLEHGGCVK
jgi:hypothetical protein